MLFMSLAIGALIVLVVLSRQRRYKALLKVFILFDAAILLILFYQQARFQIEQGQISRSRGLTMYEPHYIPPGYEFATKGYYASQYDEPQFNLQYYYKGDYNIPLDISGYADYNQLGPDTACATRHSINMTAENAPCNVIAASDGTKMYASDFDSYSKSRVVLLRKDPKMLIYIYARISNKELDKLVSSLRPPNNFFHFIPSDCWRFVNFMCVNTG
jgi:hypothetical protein